VQTCIWPSWCHGHSLSLTSVKSRLVLPFWYWLTRVVPEKGPLNGFVCVCVCVRNKHHHLIHNMHTIEKNSSWGTDSHQVDRHKLSVSGQLTKGEILLTSLSVKEFWKLVSIWQSYGQQPAVLLFFDSQCRYLLSNWWICTVIKFYVECNEYMPCLQCFDTVGWAAGRASGL